MPRLTSEMAVFNVAEGNPSRSSRFSRSESSICITKVEFINTFIAGLPSGVFLVFCGGFFCERQQVFLMMFLAPNVSYRWALIMNDLIKAVLRTWMEFAWKNRGRKCYFDGCKWESANVYDDDDGGLLFMFSLTILSACFWQFFSWVMSSKIWAKPCVVVRPIAFAIKHSTNFKQSTRKGSW